MPDIDFTTEPTEPELKITNEVAPLRADTVEVPITFIDDDDIIVCLL